MECVRILVSGCMFKMGVDLNCFSTFVPADMIYSMVQAALQSNAQREAAPHQTWLLPPCPAPGRHRASPSHFNYGWHCPRTCREKATQVLLRSPHTHTRPKRFYSTETSPHGDRDLFDMAQRCLLTHGQEKPPTLMRP